ncbi:MAG: prephenate dehydratase domain-containing protein [Planctomycetota bacterium]
MAKKKTVKKAGTTPVAKKPVKQKPAVGGGANEAASSPAALAALSELRTKIDRLDQRLVKLLNDRADLVVSVGSLKRGGDIPIYAPHREAQVLEKALARNAGPLQNRTIEGVYRELMSGSFALEQPLRIGYMGPMGSFSHQAGVKHFGSSVEFEDLRTIEGVFTEVRRGHVDYGLVPIENSVGGGVTETLDAFLEHARHVSVYAEAQIAVDYALLANCEPGSVARIHATPEVFRQCQKWLGTQYPKADQIAAGSSGDAARSAAEESRRAVEIGYAPASAAIGTPLAGETYGLNTLFERVEDRPGNVTRYLVVSRQKALRSGSDKTSVMFLTGDRPGALVSVLKIFEEAGVNLSHIDKRPSREENWRYTFFIDARGHREDAVVARVLRDARSICEELVVLGSYPESKRVL